MYHQDRTPITLWPFSSCRMLSKWWRNQLQVISGETSILLNFCF
jgi:hypothetical protein